ncbi:MAG: hypothetical protein ABI276_03150 [Acidimicrobiales bacterium]
MPAPDALPGADALVDPPLAPPLVPPDPSDPPFDPPAFFGEPVPLASTAVLPADAIGFSVPGVGGAGMESPMRGLRADDRLSAASVDGVASAMTGAGSAATLG